MFSVDDLWATLLRTVLRACERQLCRGSQDSQDTDVVLGLGLATIWYVSVTSPESRLAHTYAVCCLIPRKDIRREFLRMTGRQTKVA